MNDRVMSSQSSLLKQWGLLTYFGWRARWRTISFGVLAFWLFLTSLLALALLLMIMLRTPEGVSKGFDLIKSKNQAMSQLQSMMVTPTAPPQSGARPSDPQTSTALEQAQKVMKALDGEQVPLSMWLQTLQNHRILTTPLIVHMSPLELSPRQRLLFDVQGVVVKEWTHAKQLPASIHDVHQPPTLWVANPKPRVWVVHGSMGDLLHENFHEGQTLTSLDVVRVILWADELERQDAWYKKNPAPEPPEEIKPSYVSVHIVPSTVALQQTYWLSAGFVALLLGMGCMFFVLTEWEGMRKEGQLEALAGLPLPAYMLIAPHVGRWALNLLLGLLLAALIACGVAIYLGVPIVAPDLVLALVSAWVMSVGVMSVAIMVTSWYPSRAWRVWVMIVLLVLAISAEFVYIVMFTEQKILTMLSQPWGVALLVVVTLAFSMGAVRMGGRRLERMGRLGLRKF